MDVMMSLGFRFTEPQVHFGLKIVAACTAVTGDASRRFKIFWE
jgi:hypothetical protein